MKRMSIKLAIGIGIAFILVILGTWNIIGTNFVTEMLPLGFISEIALRVGTASAPTTTAPFFYENYGTSRIIEEAGSEALSSSAAWWVNSGARFNIAGGIGKTVQGELPSYDEWRLKYAASSPSDTDNGYHPQNIFRMLTRERWQNFREQTYVRIKRYYPSASINRNSSNGILLLSRYRDHDNLYYAGIRVDGAAIIKKKSHGVYQTLAYRPLLTGTYNRSTNPNLLPLNVWIGLRFETRNLPDGTVSVTLSVDASPRQEGNWIPVLTARDDGRSFGGAAHIDEGQAGLRTDFMDIELDDFLIANR